jgi:hypothetical protein
MTSAEAAPASRKSSSSISMSQHKMLDAHQHLKRLNKPPLKTIKVSSSSYLIIFFLLLSHL